MYKLLFESFSLLYEFDGSISVAKILQKSWNYINAQFRVENSIHSNWKERQFTHKYCNIEFVNWLPTIFGSCMFPDTVMFGIEIRLNVSDYVQERIRAMRLLNPDSYGKKHSCWNRLQALSSERFRQQWKIFEFKETRRMNSHRRLKKTVYLLG